MQAGAAGGVGGIALELRGDGGGFDLGGERGDLRLLGEGDGVGAEVDVDLFVLDVGLASWLDRLGTGLTTEVGMSAWTVIWPSAVEAQAVNATIAERSFMATKTMAWPRTRKKPSNLQLGPCLMYGWAMTITNAKEGHSCKVLWIRQQMPLRSAVAGARGLTIHSLSTACGAAAQKMLRPASSHNLQHFEFLPTYCPAF